MNVEQRLTQALATVDRLEPSPDLWSRVVHSIEEDRTHRRRVIRSVTAVVAVLAALTTAGLASLVDGDDGRYIPWQAMEAIETVGLVVLLVVLGPAIGRFGRGYASDLFPATSRTAAALLRLLDLAYAMVGTGYILLSTRFGVRGSGLLPDQLGETAERVGGLVLIFGLLHGTTLMALPLMALVYNSTRVGRPLPRWVLALLVLIGLGLLLQLPNLIGLVALGVSDGA